MHKNSDLKYISVRDFTVSNEQFDLILDTEFELLKTLPQPKDEDLSKYYESEDYISHSDNKKNLFERIYHLVKKITINNKVNLINKLYPKKGKILDIGTGTGDFLFSAKNKGWNILGFEPNIKARNISLNKQINLVNDLNDIDDNSIDVITMWHVLEHVSDLDLQINLLKRILKEDGVLIIAVPNYKSFDANYYKEYWAAYDVPRHLWHFSQNSISKLFKKIGFTVTKKYPMYFDSFYVSLLSEKYKNGKINYIKAFWIGLKSNWKAKDNFEYSSIIYVLKKENI